MPGVERIGEDPLGGGAGVLTIGDNDRCGGPGETETVAPLCCMHELGLEAEGPGETEQELGFE